MVSSVFEIFQRFSRVFKVDSRVFQVGIKVFKGFIGFSMVSKIFFVFQYFTWFFKVNGNTNKTLLSDGLLHKLLNIFLLVL